MFSKKRKIPQSDIDKIHKDFVVKIANEVSKKVKGKVYCGYDLVEYIWFISIETNELGEKRFFLDTLDYDMLAGISSQEIADNIVKYYHKIIERRFFIK